MDIKRLTIFDKEYPKILKEIYDPPRVLYYKGTIFPDEKCIAVVGTRKMTNQGRRETEKFTKGLVMAGFTIVSGLARGIDSVAHKTALAVGGRTIAVLGNGLDHIYPPENINLAKKIVNSGGVILSEYPCHAPPKPENFPKRNRIISGLSLAVLVVEARENSGSLITARCAVEQGREVFAVPPNDLINLGAQAVFNPEEITDILQEVV
ncbi:DNA-processing protein DprA [Patescibacteria group bacterium]|nr:DNA-processing protein DprA [Patescibacteria group bacterium]